jgi:L-fucose mutarotase
MMAAVEGDKLDPKVESGYRKVIEQHVKSLPSIERIERFAFYERAKKVFAVVMTGETAKYGNIILKESIV